MKLTTFLDTLLHHQTTNPQPHRTIMAEPQKDLDKLRAEQEKDDADILDELEKESKAFDKVGRAGVTCCRILHLK